MVYILYSQRGGRNPDGLYIIQPEGGRNPAGLYIIQPEGREEPRWSIYYIARGREEPTFSKGNKKIFEQAVAQINVVTVNLVKLYLHYRRCRKISLQLGADKYNFGYKKCSNIMIRSAGKCGFQESYQEINETCTMESSCKCKRNLLYLHKVQETFLHM